jgi:hypothetical protein
MKWINDDVYGRCEVVGNGFNKKKTLSHFPATQESDFRNATLFQPNKIVSSIIGSEKGIR